jgi:hypothetical protein
MCRIDASKMQHADEVADRFQRWLADAVLAADQRLLVVRVELTGKTPLNHQFRRRQNRLKASLQATAVTHGRDSVWLEDLKIHTALPDDRPAIVDMDGPLESLAVVIDELKNDPDAAEVIEHELRSLISKMPVELAGDEGTLAVDDPQWIAELIESASSEVLGRLQTSQDAPP